MNALGLIAKLYQHAFFKASCSKILTASLSYCSPLHWGLTL